MDEKDNRVGVVCLFWAEELYTSGLMKCCYKPVLAQHTVYVAKPVLMLKSMFFCLFLHLFVRKIVNFALKQI